MTFNQTAKATLVTLCLGQPVLAAEPDEIDALYDALRLSEITQIMRLEGLAYGSGIAEDLFPNQGDSTWDAKVEEIYNIDAMTAQVRSDFGRALTDQDIQPIVEFFTTEPGKSFAALEVSARRAMLDDAIKEQSEDAAAIAMSDRGPRFQKLAEFIEASDLVEPNVVGALNSNFAFYNGLMDGGFFGGSIGQDEILKDVWDQEPDIRANTTEWLYAFLLMAYDPMSDTDLTTYTEFSRTEAGQVLNDALFAGYADLFDMISYRLGRAAAENASAQEL